MSCFQHEGREIETRSGDASSIALFLISGVDLSFPVRVLPGPTWGPPTPACYQSPLSSVEECRVPNTKAARSKLAVAMSAAMHAPHLFCCPARAICLAQSALHGDGPTKHNPVICHHLVQWKNVVPPARRREFDSCSGD